MNIEKDKEMKNKLEEMRIKLLHIDDDAKMEYDAKTIKELVKYAEDLLDRICCSSTYIYALRDYRTTKLGWSLKILLHILHGGEDL